MHMLMTIHARLHRQDIQVTAPDKTNK